MKYKGIELKEFTSDKPVVFDPPKKTLVWNLATDFPQVMDVVAYLPKCCSPVKTVNSAWQHCAEIPEEQKPRRATNRELAKWLAQGNGEYSTKIGNGICSQSVYNKGTCDNVCPEYIVIRKWNDAEWHEPTVDYMGLEE